MTTIGPWLGEAAAAAPYSTVAAATILWFAFIYTVIAGRAYWLAIERLPASVATDGRTQRLRPGQVKEELLLSAVSILVFAAQATALVWMLRAGYRLVLHGLASEMLYELPVRAKRAAAH